MLNPPTQQQMFDFVSSTHAMDRIDVYPDQLNNTWNQKGNPNPYAQGHFRALMYIRDTILPSSDFPAKAVQTISCIGDSEKALFWLKEIHRKIVTPLVNHELLADDENAPTATMIGSYRKSPIMAITKPAPAPDAIPHLLHNWIIEYASFHNKIKDKIDNPYGITKEIGTELYRKLVNINLFFCTVQPFACLNQRMGRFVENTFRLAWRLPIKNYSATSDEYRRFPKDLTDFEATISTLMSAAKNVRG